MNACLQALEHEDNPMSFDSFLGNRRIVSALRAMLARDRVPNALLFTGPRGLGKYTLARLFAQAANCERTRDDSCGECSSCRRIAPLADPAALIAAGLAERGEDPDAATVERTPLILQSHPDVWVVVPDPVRLRAPVARPMIRMGQLRAVQRAAYFRPDGRRRIFILDGADTMRRTDADVFLKVLEEPPDSASLILLAPSPDSLGATIRSRCLQFHFAPVPASQIEEFLRARGFADPNGRRLAAQVSAGSPGVALGLDLEESRRLRSTALRLIEHGISGANYKEIFAITAQFAKQEKESFENVLELFYSLLTDLLEVSQGSKSSLPSNPDLRSEIERLGGRINLAWVVRATEALDRLKSGLARNIGRQSSLDAMIVSLATR